MNSEYGCEYCADDESSLSDYYGTILCRSCIEMEQNTDWDAFEENKRRRIAEQNEY